MYITYQRNTIQSPNDCVVLNLRHWAYNIYSVFMSYLSLLKTDLVPLPLCLSILTLRITGTFTIMSCTHKVVKRLMLWKGLINDLQALCSHRSPRLNYSMIIGQRVESVSSSYSTCQDSAHFNLGPSHLFVSELNLCNWFAVFLCEGFASSPTICPFSITLIRLFTYLKKRSIWFRIWT